MLCTVVGSRILIIFIVLIMIFIIMVNGNGRPPACKMQEARTGNYIPIWSGLNMLLQLATDLPHLNNIGCGQSRKALL